MLALFFKVLTVTFTDFFENIAKPYCKTSPKKTVPPVWKQRHGWLHFFEVMQPCWNALKRELNALTAFLLNHAALFLSEVQPFFCPERFNSSGRTVEGEVTQTKLRGSSTTDLGRKNNWVSSCISQSDESNLGCLAGTVAIELTNANCLDGSIQPTIVKRIKSLCRAYPFEEAAASRYWHSIWPVPLIGLFERLERLK